MTFSVAVETDTDLSVPQGLEVLRILLERLQGDVELGDGKVIHVDIRLEPALDMQQVRWDDPLESFKAGAEEAQAGRHLRPGLLSPDQFGTSGETG